MSEILVVGWITLDFIGHVDGFPTPGAAVVARDFDAACGGRAANQAMALAALESDVALIARVGSDQHAELLQQELVELDIESEAVGVAPATTGMRLIAEQPDGTQLTICYPGANDYLTVDDLNRRTASFAEARAFGITSEPPGAVVLRGLELARQHGLARVLTHASGTQVSDRVLAAADVVVVSDATSTGLLDPGLARRQSEHAARALCQRGAPAVALLLEDRAVLVTPGDAKMVESPSSLSSEDAADAFAAGLLQGLVRGEALEQAVMRGVRVACLLVD